MTRDSFHSAIRRCADCCSRALDALGRENMTHIDWQYAAGQFLYAYTLMMQCHERCSAAITDGAARGETVELNAESAVGDMLERTLGIRPANDCNHVFYNGVCVKCNSEIDE